MDTSSAPPCNLEAERSVLGSVLLDGEVFGEIAGILARSDFYSHSYGKVYEAMLDLFELGEPIDLITVENRLKTKGEKIPTADLTGLTEWTVPSSLQVKRHAELIREASRKREALTQIREAERQLLDGRDGHTVSNILTSAIEAFHLKHRANGRTTTLALPNDGKIETLGDLWRKEIPMRESFLGDSLIARGDLLIFSGPQKKGKSLASLNQALCLARGQSWLGLAVPKAIRVGIVQQEISEGSLKERLRKMLGSDGRDISLLDSIPCCSRQGLKLDTREGLDFLYSWLDKAKVDLLQLILSTHFIRAMRTTRETWAASSLHCGTSCATIRLR